MIATFLNRYVDTNVVYFDLSFDQDDVQMLRLGGVPFNIGYTEQDMINRSTEIFEGNFSDEEYELTKIITE